MSTFDGIHLFNILKFCIRGIFFSPAMRAAQHERTAGVQPICSRRASPPHIRISW